MEFQEMYGDEFFVIDTNNLNNIKQKLYGYGFNEEKIILDENISSISELNGTGAYVFLKVTDEYITIFQDFIGSYGIYVYKDENYFAISNSFLKLTEYLKDKKPISLNKDYANAFLFSDVCSFAYEKTLINEIEVLPRNYKIKINKKDKSIIYEETNYKEHTVELDSEEGMHILDSWYFKWVNILRDLKSKTNNIEINLSGGFDTRVIAAIWLTANIDLNQIKILSFEGDKGFIAEDYKIASKIANEFNFELNKPILFGEEYNFKDLRTALNISFYTKLGFHKEMYWRLSRLTSPLYSISGNGGEILRSVYDSTGEDYVAHIIEHAQQYDNCLVPSTKSVICSGITTVQKKLNVDFNSKDLPERYYKEVRTRNHYGRSAVEKYFSNIFTLTPLTDPDLQRLQLFSDESGDRSLLITLILLRYCPRLLNFDVEGNRGFKDEILMKAQKINNKYELNRPNYEFISYNGDFKTEGGRRKDIPNPDTILQKISYSNYFETEFKKIYPSKLYNKLINGMETKYHYPLSDIYSALSILIINDYVNFNSIWLSDSTSDLIKNFLEEPKSSCLEVNSFNLEQKYLKYSGFDTGRIDIINIGHPDNTIEIIDISDKSASLDFPNWFKDENGRGCVIQSHDEIINIKFKCIGDGDLNIYLRGIDYRTKNNIRVPIYINYTQLLINNNIIFNESKLICHDKSYHTSINVSNDEIIDLHIERTSI